SALAAPDGSRPSPRRLRTQPSPARRQAGRRRRAMSERAASARMFSESRALRPPPASASEAGYGGPRGEPKGAGMAERAALGTGAWGAIGLAIARVLGEEGYDLTLSARRAEKLERAVQPLRDEGFEILAVAANMTSEEEVVALFEDHRRRFGRLDALVNNA